MRKICSMLLILVLLFSTVLPIQAEASSKSYTHNASKTVLSVPSGWNVESENNTLRFKPTSGAAPMMNLQAFDLWEGLTADQRSGYKRSDFNADFFSKAEIAEVLGVALKDVSTVKLGGVEYFTAKASKSTVKYGYTFTLDVTMWLLINNGWLYLYTFGGGSDHELYNDFEKMIASAKYGGTVSSAEPSVNKFNTYLEAMKAYEKGSIREARKLFESIDGYLDSGKYLRLLDIRLMGKNDGMGRIYQKAYGLTDSEIETIHKAAEKFNFADTSEVLLCNSDVSCAYLLGEWYTSSSAPVNGYLKFLTDPVGGYCYYRSDKLSTAISNTFAINNGILSVDVDTRNTSTFKLTLMGPDCLEVYCYENGRTFVLFRK